MTRRIFILLTALFLGIGIQAQEKVQFSVQKIWDNGTYNAFTSLCKF